MKTRRWTSYSQVYGHEHYQLEQRSIAGYYRRVDELIPPVYITGTCILLRVVEL